MTPTPLANGPNGDTRTPDGRFGPGNKAAVGRSRPHASKLARLRAAWVAALTTAHIRNALTALAQKSQEGGVSACRELLTRALGTATPADLLDRVDQLEQLVERLLSTHQGHRS